MGRWPACACHVAYSHNWILEPPLLLLGEKLHLSVRLQTALSLGSIPGFTDLLGIKRFFSWLSVLTFSLLSLVGPTDGLGAGCFHVGAGSTGYTEHSHLPRWENYSAHPIVIAGCWPAAAMTSCEDGPQAWRWLQTVERAKSARNRGRAVPGSCRVDVRAGAPAAIVEHKEESDIEGFLEMRQRSPLPS